MSASPLNQFSVRLREWMRQRAPWSGELFERLALELFALQFASNHPYRRFCERENLRPGSVRRWPEIPALPAAAFKEFDVTSLPPGQRNRVFFSSGTTDQARSRHFHNPESLALYEASLLAWFQARVRAPSGGKTRPLPLVALTPSATAAPNSSLVHMFATLGRVFGAEDSLFAGKVDAAGAWIVDEQGVCGALERAVQENQPVLLLGTAFSFVHLADFLTEQQMKLQLPAGSRVLETGGYKGRSRVLAKPDLHRLIAERFGIPETGIICEYSMSELSSQAYDGFSGGSGPRVFQFPPWVRTRIVSPETGLEVGEGQTGLLRIYDLANVYSVMALQTEDLGIRRGTGFELIGRAQSAENRGCSLMAA